MEVSEHDGGVKEISEKLEKSLSMETEDNMDAYHRLIQDAKDVFRQGDTSKALEFFKSAYNIHQSQKLETRIKKIEELIAQNDSEEEDEEFVNVNNSGLMLFKDLYDKLYDYQRDGVAFMYSLYRDGRKGGILADDMGLGKTIQVISFLSGMYDNELVKHALLVMPTSLITNWTKEFAKWTPGMRVKEFHGTSKGERTRNLERVQRRGGVVITTYTMLMNNWQQLSSYHGREFTWDYMILDESIVEDMDDEDEGDEDDISDEAEEDDIIGSTNELQLEETTGETLNTEGEEEEEDCSESADGVDASAEEMCSNLEESASEPELASSERMDQCTVDAGVETNGMKDVAEDESYDSLVSRGREVYNEGKLEDALGFFLRAIDIKPGDPEIQLMTIQLYRQLSQRR
ncbi:DNA excision repair protein ERCC-6-like [Micropterus dolomieu]|uniref:DNA excision repair protein ERCC-6-like n=1 Tax=Micropterus dolomieu TaxID=147949 RepID=UPI001E8D3B70|nr:DNA excision repair protein ERCC-6-like [Micropterus dolomieu]